MAAERPSRPDDPWERSMLKGLDAFSAQEPQRVESPASPSEPVGRTDAAAPSESPQDGPELDAMLVGFERHADPPAEPEPSLFEHAPLAEDRPETTTGPVLDHESERTPARRPAVADGLEVAARLGSTITSRTKDYLGSARKNFTRPVFKQAARPVRKKARVGIDRREVAVIALSIAGLAEVGWIGWRVTNPPQQAIVVSRGPKSSSATSVERTRAQPAPAQRRSAPPAAARSKAPTPEQAPAARKTIPAPAAAPSIAKDVTPPPVSAPTAGRASGWVTIASSTPTEVFERGKRLDVRGGRVMLPVGRHDLEFRNKALGISTRRSVDVVANNEASVALDVQAGNVNVNALPWASVIIDGAPVGDTPLANLPLSAGPHDVVFKHPEFGERRLRVNVTPGTPLRVSTDLRSSK